MDVQRTTDSLKGYFLIATPVIESGFFKGTVTYVCEHGEAGAMGIVINKPLDLQLADVFEHLNIQPLLSHDEVSVMAGGPIKVDRGFVLHSPGISYDATLKVNLILQADTYAPPKSNCRPHPRHLTPANTETSPTRTRTQLRFHRNNCLASLFSTPRNPQTQLAHTRILTQNLQK